jgi:outer membrane protein TolC
MKNVRFPHFIKGIVAVALCSAVAGAEVQQRVESGDASTEGVLTLSQALRELEQSPRLQQSRSAVEEASWKKSQALAGLLPTVSAGANRLLNYKYLYTDLVFGGAPVSIPGIIPTTTFSLGFDWPVFDGLANVNRWQAGGKMAQSAEHDHEWLQFQAGRELILAFYQALAAQSLREVAQQNLKTLQEHLSDVQLFLRAGISTKYDVLRTEVLTSEARTEVLNATDAEYLARLRLATVLGKERDGRTLQGQLPVLNVQLLQPLQKATHDLTARKDIEALSERIEALHKEDQAAGRYWVPKVDLIGGYQRYNNLNSDFTDGFREAYTVGVQASWTFDGIIGPTARSEAAAARAYQAEKSLEITRLRAINDLETWKRKYLYFCEVYRSRIEDIEKSAESARIAREGRKAGTRTNSDLLDAELELNRARLGRVSAQIGSIEALVNLELATGTQLYNF